MVTPTDLTKDQLDKLVAAMSEKDGVQYTSYITLRLSRPAVCLQADNGCQRTVAMETARTILREYHHT
jgi:hypothetical protein